MGAYVKAIFDDSDTGGSGQLSLSELSTAIGIMRGRCPISRLALDTDSAVRHYEKADTNRDGVVSFAEFKEYLREHVLRTMYARNLDAEAEERRQQACALSRTPLLEARVQELVPGIDERGMHENRLLLFGGAKPAADAVLLRSNDYLQLGGHDEIAAAKAEALLHEAPGERRARVFTLDEPDRHRAFERRMASLLGAQDAVLTMSGAHAVRGLLETLCHTRTPIYADRLSWTTGSLRHSLGASVTPFPHNDMSALHSLAAEESGVIVVDGVYGHGAVGKLSEAADVAEATGSVLVVDETHSFGCGAGGLGVSEEQGVSHRVHFRTIGLSKACASRGGVIVGPSRALEAFRFVDKQMIFSTAPFDHEIVGYDTTLDVLLRDDWRREALHANHRRLKEGLLDLGYQDAVAQSDRQIISIITGGASSTAAFRDFCAERGVFGSVFCPPAAREGRSYLRFTINCAVTASQCEHFLAVMEDARPLLR